MKKVLILIFFWIIFLAGCNHNNPQISNNCDHTIPNEYFQDLNNRPIFITSLGQSIDIENFIIRLEHYKISNYTRENILDPGRIENNSIVIIIAGCSTKGLGDAGTDVANEIERARTLNNLKKNKNLLILVFHIGGKDRRGATSDYLIQESFRISDLAFFLSEGNQDNYLCDLAHEFEIPHQQYTTIGQIDSAILTLFNIQP